MSATYTMRKLAEQSPRAMDDSDEAARSLGHEIAAELDMEDVTDAQALRLGRAAWGLADGTVRPGYVRAHVLTRRHAMREG